MNTSVRLSTLDLPALMANLHRESVGFDNMFDNLRNFQNSPESVKYPPHDIVKINETCYTIEIAVAGFTEEDLSVSVDKNLLKIKGELVPQEREYLHRGISKRNFSKVISLAEHVVVRDAHCNNGMLVINLEIVIPEELKPRTIAIGGPKVIDQ
jgi:molecular chaperone IbpA